MAINKNSTLGFFIFILLAGITGAWLTHLHVKETVPLINSSRTAALPVGRELLKNLSTYPSATPRTEITEKESTPSKGMWRGVKNVVVWQQEFEAPGVKDELLRWFTEKLSAQGWKVWDPRDTSDLHTQ